MARSAVIDESIIDVYDRLSYRPAADMVAAPPQSPPKLPERRTRKRWRFSAATWLAIAQIVVTLIIGGGVTLFVSSRDAQLRRELADRDDQTKQDLATRDEQFRLQLSSRDDQAKQDLATRDEQLRLQLASRDEQSQKDLASLKTELDRATTLARLQISESCQSSAGGTYCRGARLTNVGPAVAKNTRIAAQLDGVAPQWEPYIDSIENFGFALSPASLTASSLQSRCPLSSPETAARQMDLT